MKCSITFLLIIHFLIGVLGQKISNTTNVINSNTSSSETETQRLEEKFLTNIEKRDFPMKNFSDFRTKDQFNFNSAVTSRNRDEEIPNFHEEEESNDERHNFPENEDDDDGDSNESKPINFITLNEDVDNDGEERESEESGEDDDESDFSQ